MSKQDKTLTRSFRISQVVFDALREEAERNRVTVNTLVNQMFLAYVNFDRYFERMGVVKISAATFDLLLAAASEDRIAEASRNAGTDAPKAIIIAKEGAVTLHSVLDFLNLMSEYANLFEYNEVSSQDGGKIITLMHRLGQNGSTFLGNYVRAIFEAAGIEPKITFGEHSVVFEVKRPQ